MLTHPTRFVLLPLLTLSCTFSLPAVVRALPGKPPVSPAKKTSAFPAPDKPLEITYGWFANNQRIGYFSGTRKRALYQGKAAMVGTLTLRASYGSAAFSVDYVSWKTMGGKSLEESEVTTIAGKTKREHTTHTDKNVSIETTEPGKAMHRRILSVTAYEKQENSSKQETGLSGIEIFIPGTWKTVSSEVVTVAFQPVKAYRVQPPKTKQSDHVPVLWMDKERNMVRADFWIDDVSMRFERMPLKLALAPLSREIAMVTIPSAKPLATPRAMRVARYQITGLAYAPAVVDDDVQAMTVEKTPDGKYNALISVATGPAESAPTVTLADMPRVKFAAFLQPGKLTSVQSDEATRLAREIIGGETNAARAAQRLSRWVYENIRYDWEFSGLRTAAQTLKDRRGVCQNYATLLVTLARAAGIPAKYCAGPTYDDGKYFPHAWAECWVGKWVAFEPTWGVPFADAARIKLAEGEPDAPLTSWDTAAPPRIAYLAAGEKPVPFADQQAAQNAERDKAAKALAQRIEAAAKNDLQPALLTVSSAIPPITVVTVFLPFGTTADYRAPGTVQAASGNGERLPAIEFILPDGRRCFVIDPIRGTSLTPDQATARSFEYSTDAAQTWTRAIVDGYQPDSDPQQLAKRIQDQADTGGVCICSFHPASSEKVLSFLPAGSTTVAQMAPNYRTAKGVYLPGSFYRLPNGKNCYVFEVSP